MFTVVVAHIVLFIRFVLKLFEKTLLTFIEIKHFKQKERIFTCGCSIGVNEGSSSSGYQRIIMSYFIHISYFSTGRNACHPLLQH